MGQTFFEQARMDSLVCVLRCLDVADTSDSPLMRQLLNSWRQTTAKRKHALFEK